MVNSEEAKTGIESRPLRALDFGLAEFTNPLPSSPQLWEMMQMETLGVVIN